MSDHLCHLFSFMGKTTITTATLNSTNSIFVSSFRRHMVEISQNHETYFLWYTHIYYLILWISFEPDFSSVHIFINTNRTQTLPAQVGHLIATFHLFSHCKCKIKKKIVTLWKLRKFFVGRIGAHLIVLNINNGICSGYSSPLFHSFFFFLLPFLSFSAMTEVNNNLVCIKKMVLEENSNF